MLQRIIRLVCLFLPCLLMAQAFSATTPQRRTVSVVWNVEESSSTVKKDEQDESTLVPKTSSSNQGGSNMPPVIQQIADERRQYQMNLGKAMDVLRKDMQDILTKRPGT